MRIRTNSFFYRYLFYGIRSVLLICFLILFTGSAIERICEETEEEVQILADRTALVRAARCLLGAVTRVLLLADIVVVKQLLLAKDKVQFTANSYLLIFFLKKNSLNLGFS